MKNNKGISIISFILTILIIILIGFIVYEIFYVDIFDMIDDVAIVNTIGNKNKVIYNSKVENENKEYISTVEPIIEEKNQR